MLAPVERTSSLFLRIEGIKRCTSPTLDHVAILPKNHGPTEGSLLFVMGVSIEYLSANSLIGALESQHERTQ